MEYGAYDYTPHLQRQGLRPSMSRAYHSHDNAHMESFFHSMKAEWIRGCEFHSFTELHDGIKAYMRFYNHHRLHSGIDYHTPEEYERLHRWSRVHFFGGRSPPAAAAERQAVRRRQMKLGWIAILVFFLCGMSYCALRPVCVPLSSEDLAQFNVPIEKRTDHDLYLRVFQLREGQWHQCKTWLSRQFFF